MQHGKKLSEMLTSRLRQLNLKDGKKTGFTVYFREVYNFYIKTDELCYQITSQHGYHWEKHMNG